MKIIAAIAVSIVAATGTLQGGDERELAEELMRLMKVEQNLEQMRPQMKTMLANVMNSMEVPEEIGPKLLEKQQIVVDLALDAMSWQKMKPHYIDIYVELFDSDELAGLVNFYSSPVGKSFISKMPLLIQRTMELSQAQAVELIPEIQALTEKMIRELAEE